MAAEATLAQENAKLKEELAALKERYGVRDDGAKTKKNRQVFDSFDTDKNGTIDCAEFQQLCYECGIILDKEQQAAAIAKIDSDKNGVISFDEFNTWLLEAQDEEKDGDGLMVMLRMRLLGNALYRRASVAKETLNEAKIRREQAGGDEQKKTINWDLKVSIGDDQDLKSGLFLKVHNSDEDGEDAREKAGAPDECPTFVYADLACKPDASDVDIGGLVALLETLIGEAPQLDPENGIYHSHSVSVKEENGEKRIRIAFFSPINPIEAGEGAIGVNPVELVNRAEISIESGIDLADLKTAGYNIVEHLAAKLAWSLEIDPYAVELAEKIGEAVGKGPKPGMSFFRRANTEVEFNSVYEFVHAWDGYEERVAARLAAEGIDPTATAENPENPDGGAKKRGKVPGVVKALRNVPPGPELVEKVTEFLGVFLGAGEIPDPIRDTYEGVRKCVSGLRYIRAQADNAGLSLEVRGLDCGEYLPEIPPPEEG